MGEESQLHGKSHPVRSTFICCNNHNGAATFQGTVDILPTFQQKVNYFLRLISHLPSNLPGIGPRACETHPGRTHMSAAQTAANRHNAKHSTGPRTEEGKRRSAANSTKHGLTSSAVVLPNESQEEYESFRT